jgi:hypothetical protein
VGSRLGTKGKIPASAEKTGGRARGSHRVADAVVEHGSRGRSRSKRHQPPHRSGGSVRMACLAATLAWVGLQSRTRVRLKGGGVEPAGVDTLGYLCCPVEDR